MDSKNNPGSVNKGDDDIQHDNMQVDPDEKYNRMGEILKWRPPQPRDERKPDEKRKDYEKSLRTRVVMLWVMSNLLLVVTVLRLGYRVVGIDVEDNTGNAGTYLSVGTLLLL